MGKSLMTIEMLAFQLGFRFSLLSGTDKGNLEMIIQEILDYACEPKALEAFNLGQQKAVEDKRIIEQILKCEAKQRQAFIKELEQKSLSNINLKK